MKNIPCIKIPCGLAEGSLNPDLLDVLGLM